MDKPNCCPKCGSNFLAKNDLGDYECLCGKVIYSSPIDSGVITRRRSTTSRPASRPITVAGHYPKVSDKIPVVVKLYSNGDTIKHISRENGIAINTVRKIVRSELFTLHDKVREGTI